MHASSNNDIHGNTMTNNDICIHLSNASDNSIYHNDFVNNTLQAQNIDSVNFWDIITLTEGNYWSDYNGFDENGDRKGDTPYIIDENNQDNYPLIIPRGPIPFYWEEIRYDCIFDGNTTMSMLDFSHPSKSISFDISLATKTGYFDVIVPRQLLDGHFKVLVANTPIAYMLTWNQTYTSIILKLTIPPFSKNSIYNVKIIADEVTPLIGDINNDNCVDIFDVVLIANHFGEES